MTTIQTETPFVPTFDTPPRRAASSPSSAARAPSTWPTPASSSATPHSGEGIETHLFFTFWGFDMINKKTQSSLKATLLGNTAMHMPQGLGGIPGMTHLATSQLKKAIAELDIPEVPDFLDQIVASGGHLWACRLSADMNHLTEEDLRDDVEGIISASDFIEMTAGAQLLFI